MFQTIKFSTPLILFGMDTIQQLGQQAKKLGAGRTLLVTGPHVKEAGVLDKALSSLKGIYQYFFHDCQEKNDL